MTGWDGSAARVVLFDIDGTLLHAGDLPRRVFRASLLEVFGTAGTVDAHEFAGKTDPQIVREVLALAGVPGERIRAGLDRALARYLSLLEEGLRDPAARPYPLPGVTALLDALALRPGCALGLLTGNVEPGARLKLDAAGLGGRFAFGAFGSDSAHRPDLTPFALRRALALGHRPGRLVVVGDTPRDVECGAHAGARTVAVATGRYGVQSLRAAGADVVLENFDDTPGALAAILG